MKRLPTADRDDERALYASMLAGQTAERILLIEAASGLGKSDLLDRFEDDCPSDTLLIRIDLKAAQTGVLHIFRQTLDELGRDRFPRFLAASEQTRGGVNIADNRVFGQLQIQIDSGSEERTRADHLMALHNAFFEDLRALNQPLLFMFDTYETAVVGSELDKWISSEFLASAVRTSHLVVVIAGQRVPAPTSEWRRYHEHCRLGPIRNPDVWQVCAQSARIPLERHEIQTLCWAVDGHYSQMMALLVRRAQEQGL
jgi:hypothetical protein